MPAPPEHPPRWSEYMDLESLRPDPRNPKAHDIDLLRASLGRWGYVEPVVVDERTGLLVAGHGRRELLLADLASGAEPPEGVVAEGKRWTLCVQRGWSSVDDDEAGAYLVASNQIGVVGGWDTVALAELLAGVAEGPGLDGVGFDTIDLTAMLAEIAPPPVALRDPDDVPEPPAEPVTRLGDVWIMGPHRLICGDAGSITLPDRPSVLLCDPPYGMNLDTDFSGMVGSLSGSQTHGREYQPIIGDDLPFDPRPIMARYGDVREQFWFGADYYADRIPDRLDGSWLVWDKRTDSQAGGFGSEFEMCWSRQRHKRRMLRHDWFGFLSSANAADARHHSHPTQKPVTLFADILRQWHPPGAVVADLYAGSGTTLIACHQEGRVARLIEISPAYCDVICRRFEEFSGIVPVLESTGEEHSFCQSGEDDVAAFLADSDSPVS